MNQLGVVIPLIISMVGSVVFLGMLWMFIAVVIQIGGQVLFKTQVPRATSGWSAAVVLVMMILFGIMRSFTAV